SDLLLALPVHTTYVQQGGIVHYQDSQQWTFTHHVDGKFSLPLGAAVTYRVDPLGRGICAVIEGNTYWLPAKEDQAQREGRAREVVRQQGADARAASDTAAQLRAAALDGRLGPGAAAAFKDLADAERAAATAAARASALLAKAGVR